MGERGWDGMDGGPDRTDLVVCTPERWDMVMEEEKGAGLPDNHDQHIYFNFEVLKADMHFIVNAI